MKSDLPKVLFEVAGTPMLGHVLNATHALQCKKPILVVGFGADQVIQRYPNAVHIHQEQQLGTGHAVAICKAQVDPNDTVLVLYGDVPLITSATLEKVCSAADKGIALLTTQLPDPAGYGRILRNSKGHVTGIVEQKDATPDQLNIQEVNTGILAAKGSNLMRWVNHLSNDNAQGEYYLTDVVAMAVAEGLDVQTISADPAEVTGANSRRQLAALERLYQSQQAAKLMDAGITIKDPARFDVRGTLTVGENTVIDFNCLFEGNVYIGNNVIIEPNCIIKDARIGDGSHIRAYSHIEGTTIGNGVTVGPYARLREGTHLKDDSKIGNFVETKKATIGEGSKVNHLSYIGDTHMGEGVNVGAGTITCNYDGTNKHQTTIGDGVFIGSNTALVAPVTLENNSTIAAGSTITKTVDTHELGIARGKQRNIKEWKKTR